jgi:hypothetical protein
LPLSSRSITWCTTPSHPTRLEMDDPDRRPAQQSVARAKMRRGWWSRRLADPVELSSAQSDAGRPNKAAMSRPDGTERVGGGGRGGDSREHFDGCPTLCSARSGRGHARGQQGSPGGLVDPATVGTALDAYTLRMGGQELHEGLGDKFDFPVSWHGLPARAWSARRTPRSCWSWPVCKSAARFTG